MRIVPDRDRVRKYYLDEPVEHVLHNGHILSIDRGYRFDGHSVPLVSRWLFPKYNERDIYAALVHDALVDTMPWHRYPRKFIDTEYAILMNTYSYGRRKYWMPLAVMFYGWLITWGWRDYRGDYEKYATKVSVTVTMV